MRWLVLGGALLALALALAIPAPAEQGAKGRWVNISDSLIAKLAGEGIKPGYAGPTAGIAVDPASGDVYLVVNDQGLYRSTDKGTTFARVADGKTVGYWTSDAGLLASKDKGATWAVQGSPVRAFQGPFFGKDESHIVVVGKEGFQETTDAGKTWKLAAPLPADYVADRMTLCAWDASANIFYISRMTKPAFKFVR
jgi:hypothetical protein